MIKDAYSVHRYQEPLEAGYEAFVVSYADDPPQVVCECHYAIDATRIADLLNAANKTPINTGG